jgi:hypothetical protein
MIRTIVTFFFGCLFSAQLLGQELRQIEFTVYGQYPLRGVEYLPTGEMAIAAGTQAEAPRAIETHSLSRRGPYNFTGGSVIRFRETATGQEVASVRIPENSDKWLLVFVRNPLHKTDPQKNPKYLIYPFDDSLARFPGNSLIFLNISGKALEGSLNGNRIKLGKGESGRFRIQKSLPISLWMRDFSGDRYIPAHINTYYFEPEHRYLIVLFPPALRGSADLDVRFLVEDTRELD